MAEPGPDFETQPHLPAKSDGVPAPVPAPKSAADQTHKPKGIRRLLGLIGPGLITGAAGDDPSGIATYVQTGVQFGYGLLWTQLFVLPLLTAVQEASARIGAVTGKGLAAVMREHYGARLVYSLVLLLLIANTINIGADIGAMAAAAQLIVPLPFVVLALSFTASMLVREIFIPYAQYVKFLKWLTVSLLAYPVTVFVVHEPWGTILRATFVPHLAFTPAFLFILTGVVGTTITPYSFFWEASQEVEEERDHGLIGPNGRPKISRNLIRDLRIDSASGMITSQLVSWCIIVVGATVLHNGGTTNVNSAADAAKALVPLVHTFPHAGT
ncbi:MAG TPA: divalent metal cation transporter, partial [Chloroflexota bacterium]